MKKLVNMEISENIEKLLHSTDLSDVQIGIQLIKNHPLQSLIFEFNCCIAPGRFIFLQSTTKWKTNCNVNIVHYTHINKKYAFCIFKDIITITSFQVLQQYSKPKEF